LPTGDPTSYISDGSATGELRLLSELNLVALSLRASVGAKVRGAETSYVNQGFGHELPWGARPAAAAAGAGLGRQRSLVVVDRDARRRGFDAELCRRRREPGADRRRRALHAL